MWRQSQGNYNGTIPLASAYSLYGLDKPPKWVKMVLLDHNILIGIFFRVSENYDLITCYKVEICINIEKKLLVRKFFLNPTLCMPLTPNCLG